MLTVTSASSTAIVRPLTDREFARFKELVYREAGINLGPTKQALVAGRLARRVRELQLTTFDAYYEAVVADESGAELVRCIDAIATNETHFFREPRHFELVERQAVPRWREQAAAGLRPRTVRVWSAACSTGEEPYSLAMLLHSLLPAEEGWTVEIVATDISTKALAAARAATWSIEKSREIPHAFLRRFMLRGTGAQEGRMRAGPELRAAVRFARLNLHESTYDVQGPFDLVFCRNVLIYFDLASKRGVIDRLFDHLHPDGFFFLGHAESLHGVTDRGRVVIPTVYRHAAAERLAAFPASARSVA